MILVFEDDFLMAHSFIWPPWLVSKKKPPFRIDCGKMQTGTCSLISIAERRQNVFNNTKTREHACLMTGEGSPPTERLFASARTIHDLEQPRRESGWFF
jgi:hypothetical protein